MKEISPDKLILKCYGYKIKDKPWVGVCLNFDFSIQADSIEELEIKMNNVIRSYVESVLDTEDVRSIPALLTRRAPVKEWLIYYFIKFIKDIHYFAIKAKDFKENIPFHLAHDCANG
jgi:hypothetical protein